MSTLLDVAHDKRLVALVGEGGVGKTSCAAALGLAAAQHGRRVAVLTIDPAPRLGHALGLERMDDTPRPVALGPGTTARGSLDAFRLDTKTTFDRVVERLARGPEAAARIVRNPIYRALAGTVGESESYMALQRLHELREENHYDLLILDTPPVVHAGDLLAAPSRLAALIESDAARVLANPAVILARASSSLAKASAAIILPLLERVTGLALRRQLAEFIGEFETVLFGLTERARHVEEWLRSGDAAFALVTRATGRAAPTAAALVRSFAERKLRVEALVVNRLSPSPRPRAENGEALLAAAPTGTAGAVESMERAMQMQRSSESAALARLRADVAPLLAGRALVVELESLEHDVAGVTDLIALGAGESADAR